jgi:dGTPase
LTHTLEAAQIARTAARALFLNEDLVEAIALGHDLGHTPFGHAGEVVLNEVYAPGFRHAEQSLRVVDKLEPGRDGLGLNLTFEVRDGILKHSKGNDILLRRRPDPAATLEAELVSVCDAVAYINHDIDDAIRAGVIRRADLPAECVAALGDTHAERITTMVSDVVEHSRDQREIRMGPEVETTTNRLKDFLYQRVYRAVLDLGDAQRVQRLIAELFRFYMAHPAVVSEGEDAAARGRRQLARRVCDHLAGMTDRFAAREFEAHFVPRRWRD